MLGGYKVTMAHYICPGTCKGVAMEAGACRAIECPKYNEALIECGCTDGNHNLKPEGTEVN